MAFDKQILNNDVDAIGKLAVGGDFDFGITLSAGADRFFRAIGTSPNIIINLVPKGTGTLRVPAGYDLLINDVKDLVNKGYADGRIGGLPIDPSLATPGAPQDGYSIVWDNDTGKYVLAPSANTNTFASGVENVSGVIKLGGTVLDRHTDVPGVGTFNLNLGTTASKLLNFGLNVGTKAELIAGTAKLVLNGTNPVELLGGAALSSFVINAGGGLTITDNQGGVNRRGLRGAADYSDNVLDNDYTQKIYTDNRLAGKSVSALVKTPTASQDGHAVMWSQILGQYTLADPAGPSGSVSTIPKKQKFTATAGQTTFTVTNGTILYLNFVDINGSVQAEGEDFIRSGQNIVVTPGLETGYEITVYYWEDISLAVGGGGGGSIQNGHFLFDTGTAETDPGDGKVKLNTTNFTTVSEIYIDELTMESTSIGAALQDMASGDEIRLQLSSNDDNNAVYKLLAMPLNNAGWWTLSVVNMRFSGPVFASLSDVVVVLLFGGSAGGATSNVDGGVADSIYNTLPVVDGGTP